MAPKMLKRPAAAAGLDTPGPQKKAASAGKGKCSLVADALQDAEGLREMLGDLVVGSLGVLKDARHPYQTAMVDMIGESLERLSSSLQQAVVDAQAKVDGADGEKVSREALVETEQATLKSLEASCVERKTELQEATTALKESSEALQDAKTKQQDGDALLAAVTESRTTLEATRSSLEVLKTRALGAADVKKLISVGAKYQFDSSLLATLPATLKKEPDSRGKFDGITLEQLDGEFNRCLGELVATLEKEEPGRVERAAAVEAAELLCHSTKEKKDACTEALDAAKVAQKQGAAALSAAERAVKQFFPDMKVAADMLDSAKANLATFTNGPLAAFNELKDAAPPAPPAVVEEVAAAAPEEPVAPVVVTPTGPEL